MNNFLDGIKQQQKGCKMQPLMKGVKLQIQRGWFMQDCLWIAKCESSSLPTAENKTREAVHEKTEMIQLYAHVDIKIYTTFYILEAEKVQEIGDI